MKKNYRSLLTANCLLITTHCLLICSLFTSASFALVTNINSSVTHSSLQSAVNAAVSGDTLLVSTGQYTYMQINSKNLTIIGGYAADFSSVVSYNNTIMDGISYCANFTHSTSTVENLTFTSASYGMAVFNYSVVTAIHCTVENNINYNQGGGIKVFSGGMLLLDHTDVENNSVTNTTGDGNGGGAYISNGKLIVSEYSHIRENYAAEKGGGIYVSSGSGSVEVKSSSFISANSADEAGGGVYLNGGELVIDGGAIGYLMSDPNSTPNNGGGIYARNASVSFQNNHSDLRNNYAGNDGGGIYSTNSSIVFTGYSGIGYEGNSKTNYAGDDGGGIYAVDSTVALSNADVFACYADGHGGAIYAEFSDVILYNCEFGNTNDDYTNISGKDGGAIDVEDGNLFINKSTFFNNQADDDGGAIRIDDSNLTITNSIFRNNIAIDNGGALFANDGTAIANISDSIIITNSGDDGGGIWWNSDSNMTIQSSVINANEADDDGGGIFLRGLGVVTLDDVEMIGNKAIDDGGAICVFEGQNLKLIDCDIRLNYADSDSNNNGNGGGLAIDDKAKVEIVAENKSFNIGANRAENGAAIYIANEFSVVDLVSTSGYRIYMASNNASGDGGVIHADDKSEVNILGKVWMTQDRADNGGAISATGGAIIGLENYENYQPQIHNCTAWKSGGAISIVESDTLVTCNGVIFGVEGFGNNSNGAGEGYGGGAVAVADNSEFRAIDCIFEENDSASDGGALYVSNATAIVSGNVAGGVAGPLPPSLFFNNTAVGSGNYGGAIYVANGYAEIFNTAIISNSASRGGGIYGSYADAYLENVLIAQNRATLNSGSGIRLFNATASMNFCTVANNFRSGIEVATGGLINMTNCIVYGHTVINVTSNPAQNIVYSDIQGGYSGIGNISITPLFADILNLDYRLTAASPCTNMAINIGITNDCIGLARPQLGGYDMGAYEFIPEPMGIFWIFGILELWIIGRNRCA